MCNKIVKTRRGKAKGGRATRGCIKGHKAQNVQKAINVEGGTNVYILGDISVVMYAFTN